MSKLIEKVNNLIKTHDFDKINNPTPLYINDLNLPKNVTFTYFGDTVTKNKEISEILFLDQF